MTSTDTDSDAKPMVIIDGQPVNIFSPVQALTDIITELKTRRDSFLACTLNVDHLVKLRSDDAFRAAYSKARFVTADGFPIVMLARVRGHSIQRTTGSDLIVPLCQAAASAGYSIFLLGSTDDTLAKAAQYLKQNCPGLEIAGMAAPPYGFDPTSDMASRMADTIAASGARLCLVALGAPLQERFSAHAMELTRGVGFMGVGASLDFFSGRQQRAPKLVQSLNMEWAWRLFSNPRRLWLRYAKCGALVMELLWNEILTTLFLLRNKKAMRDTDSRGLSP